MEFSLNEIKAEPRNWVDTKVAYEGPGTATFLDPPGRIEGVFRSLFDELGNMLVECEVQSIQAPPEFEGNVLHFLFGTLERASEEKKVWSIGGRTNQCGALEFHATNGRFLAQENVDAAGISTGEATKVRFSTFGAQFDTQNSAPGRYFAIPLINLLDDFSNKLLCAHPLRIHPTPPVPDSVPQNMRLLASMKANEKNKIIGFELDGLLHFIEPLPDYESRALDLKAGQQRRVTAVLVGDLGNRSASNWSDVRSWHPFAILAALGFASGTEVGAPWIEIRDEAGSLLRRIHAFPPFPAYSKGTVVLSGFNRGPDSGMGEFLKCYLMTPSSKRQQLEIIMDHARLGTVKQRKTYDALDHLVRGLDCLCEEYGVSTQELMEPLDAATQNHIKMAIIQAAGTLKELRQKARSEGLHDKARHIGTIKSRILNAPSRDRKFGLAVTMLLEKLQMPDSTVVDKFYAAHPRKDGMDWASVLSEYRGATIHLGALDYVKKHDVGDVFRVCRHLQDILTRIVLKEVGYKGTYQPPLTSSVSPQPLDWVKPDTDPGQLGYS